MPEEQKVNQELFMRATILQQQSQEIEQNLQIIDNQISEMDAFSKNLSDLSDSNEKEILASIGKGVYIKANLENKDLFVDVGAGTIVKQTPGETREIIDSQIPKLREARIQLTAQLESFHAQFHELVQEIEKEKSEK